MVRVAATAMTGPHYAAVVARLIAGGIRAAHGDALSLRALAVSKPSRGLQKAMTARLLARNAEAWRATAMAVADGTAWGEHTRAWVRSSAVPQPFFGAWVGHRWARVPDPVWRTTGRMQTRQPILTPDAVGGPLPVGPDGRQRCPYEVCQQPMPCTGDHSGGCNNITQSTMRHDTLVNEVAKVVKAAAGAGVLVQREPHLRADAAHYGGLRPTAPATDLRADTLFVNAAGDRLTVDYAFANPSSTYLISAAAAADGGAGDISSKRKQRLYGAFFHNPTRIVPVIVETPGRVVDNGFLTAVARMAVGAMGPGAGGVAYARVMAELRLRISLVVWRYNAYSAHRLVGAVARRVAGGGVDFLPSVGKGGLGGGHGGAAGG
jgi:hypothetical protein